MAKPPVILAALANDAAPHLSFNSVKPIGSEDGLFDSALLTNASDGVHYSIKMPRNKVAGLALDTELSVIRAFNDQIRARLPFEITRLVGSTRDADGTRAMVFSFVYGNPIDVANLPAEHPLTESIGKALAAIHSLPVELVENAGLPSFNPQASITLRVAELDKARETGRIPSVLNERWEKAFEDISLFKYQPCVIHSDLNGDKMLELDGEVAGVLGWTGLRIGDPAEDFGWILGSQNFDAVYSILLAYQQAKPSADPNIRQRALLYSELEIVRWLMYSLKHENETDVNHALEMLAVLAQEVQANEAPSLSTAPLAAGVAAAGSAGASDEPIFTDDALPNFITSTPLEPSYDPVDISMPIISEGEYAVEEAEEFVSTHTRPIEVVAAESDEDVSQFSDEPIDELAQELGSEPTAEEEAADFDERKDESGNPKDDELF